MTFWSDSTTVLQYLKNDAKRFYAYVANHVAFIRANSNPDQWRYVSSKDNPADEASRGSSLTAFLKNERWKCGPKFSQQPESEWPATPTINDPSSTDPVGDTSAVFIVDTSEEIYRLVYSLSIEVSRISFSECRIERKSTG